MLFQPLMLGILLFQVLYSLVQWYYSHRREFLYYAGYSVILSVYFFLKHEVVDHSILVGSHQLNENFINRQLVYLAMYIYVEFARWFMDRSARLPAYLNKQVVAARRIMLAYIVARIVWSMFADESLLQEIAHVVFSVSSFLFFAYISYKVYKLGYMFGRLMVVGSLLLTSGALVALLARVVTEFGYDVPLDPLVFLEIGVILDLIFINTGLVYKSKFLLEEKRMLPVRSASLQQPDINLQSIRSEISEELQAELGRGLNEIKYMSDVVRERTGKTFSIELERISENSERLVRSMNEIVWALNEQNDELEKVISYLAEYARHFTQQVHIVCTMDKPANIPRALIVSDVRRHIFMAFKEALHNIIKHSNATAVHIKFEVKDVLLISIADNGRGFDLNTPNNTFGNGVKNMKSRMNMLHGNLEIYNKEGAHIIFTIPLPQEEKDDFS